MCPLLVGILVMILRQYSKQICPCLKNFYLQLSVVKDTPKAFCDLKKSKRVYKLIFFDT